MASIKTVGKCLIEIPDKAPTQEMEELILKFNNLIKQIKALNISYNLSQRNLDAFELMKVKRTFAENFSVQTLLEFHKSLGGEGILRQPPKSWFCENNIGIREYRVAPADKLEIILNEFIKEYHPHKKCDFPLLKITKAYLHFGLIHPFSDRNGRVGRLIASWLMYEYNYDAIAPYLEEWFGNENREHGKHFELPVHNYIALCNSFSPDAFVLFLNNFFSAFAQNLITKCEAIIQRKEENLSP